MKKLRWTVLAKIENKKIEAPEQLGYCNSEPELEKRAWRSQKFRWVHWAFYPYYSQSASIAGSVAKFGDPKSNPRLRAAVCEREGVELGFKMNVRQWCWIHRGIPGGGERVRVFLKKGGLGHLGTEPLVCKLGSVQIRTFGSNQYPAQSL